MVNMARADLIKKLFLGYQNRDDSVFFDAAKDIIHEERKKHHVVVAKELENILNFDDDYEWKLNWFRSIPSDSDKKTGLIDIYKPDRHLEDLILNVQIKDSIEQVAREYREWEVLETNGLIPSNKMLFCGPTGCGKTATAEAISKSLNLPLIYVKFDSVVSSLLGETAANIRKVFDFAKRGQWVMFFDEFDAIGRSRDDVTEHSEIKRVVNSFLQILDRFKGQSIIIAATNFEQALDPALWRRFDEIVRFERPDEEQIRRLIKKLLKSHNVDNQQVSVISENLTGSSFADVERLCIDIKKNCVLCGSKSIGEDDVSKAKQRFYYRRNVLVKSSFNDNPSIERG